MQILFIRFITNLNMSNYNGSLVNDIKYFFSDICPFCKKCHTLAHRVFYVLKNVTP